ncbi:phage holin family protein [Sulfurirhabdus autotrophica]|uniref:Putative membrane protein n=1 Tax=Sulfurirhabdus autotrophica TaxID=1706046 RepID=A0A4V2W1S8_9PROT|nr:phage holin family protein [Sulfurirhabdus autotrophica]TCV85369.1 putative membrane protein [Sulfurirhabdus autotrophica]
MLDSFPLFLLHLCITAFSLWIVSFIFHGVTFSTKTSLFVSALLLGFANAIVRPVLIFMTLPLTLVTFGFFLLVINALMMLLVAAMVPGFKITGFWTAFFASIFVAIISFFMGMLLFSSGSHPLVMPTHGGIYI